LLLKIKYLKLFYYNLDDWGWGWGWGWGWAQPQPHIFMFQKILRII